MVHVIQPALSALVGFALAAYGLFHTATHVPPREVFSIFWSALPSVASVFIFLLGLAAIVLGVTLIARGVQNVRRRARTVNRVLSDPRMHRADPDDDYEAGYGYR